MTAKFLYRNNVQLNFPVTLRSFLIHFLERHVKEAISQISDQRQRFHFHMIFRSHFSDQQESLSLDVDTGSMDFEQLMDCIERNMEHLSFHAPVSGFTLIATVKEPKRAKTLHFRKRPAPRPTETGLSIATA